MTEVEVFADITCPFAHVGLSCLVRHRERIGRHDVVLRVRAWPLELVNGEPLAGGSVGEKVAALRSGVAPDLFAGFDAGRFPRTTLPALELAAAAYARDVRTGELASLTLRRALFEEGRDISQPDVLDAVSLELGLDRPGQAAHDAVMADWETGRALGVEGSPHFFVAGRAFFCPMLDIHHVDDHLRIQFDRERFEAFVGLAFGRPTEPTEMEEVR